MRFILIALIACAGCTRTSTGPGVYCDEQYPCEQPEYPICVPFADGGAGVCVGGGDGGDGGDRG